MTRSQKWANATVAELLAAYSAAASAHGRATLSGNPKEANRQFHQLHSAYAELRRRGDTDLRHLEALLDDADPGVRGWAGAHLLLLSPSKAEPTLEELGKMPGLVGFSARITIQEWRKGKLRFS
jgi:hypothetical protein